MMLAILTMLCVTLSLLLTINAVSLRTHQHQASQQLVNEYLLHQSALPRKLMINTKFEGYEANSKGLVTSNGHNTPSSGKLHKYGDEVDLMVHAARGTRQEWIEGSDSIHEFFTMDYSHVRRRRPIHNKSSTKTITNSP